MMNDNAKMKACAQCCRFCAQKCQQIAIKVA
jgi:hypothetical protein